MDVHGNSSDEECSESIIQTKEFKEGAMQRLVSIKKYMTRTKRKNSPYQLLQRKKRGGKGKEQVVVRCKNSYTGLFSFLAVPLLLGDIMIDFMSMIDIMIMIMTPEAPPPEPMEPGEPPGNNNNNNNNNNGGMGGGMGGMGGMGGNNNNNMNMNGRSFSNARKSWDEIYQNISEEFVMEKMPAFFESYFDPKSDRRARSLPVSGDWTDSADFVFDIQGPFSGVIGWNNQAASRLLPGKLKNHIQNKR